MWKGLFSFLYSLAFAFFDLHKLVSGSWLSTEILGNLSNWNSTWEWNFLRNLQRNWFTTFHGFHSIRISLQCAINNQELNCTWKHSCKRQRNVWKALNILSSFVLSSFQSLKQNKDNVDQSLWKRNLSNFDLFESKAGKEKKEICR